MSDNLEMQLFETKSIKIFFILSGFPVETREYYIWWNYKNVKFYFSANKNLTNTELLFIEREREWDKRAQKSSSW